MTTITIGKKRLTTPMLWLGHDLKSRLQVWNHVPNCRGIMISAHQVLMRDECFLRSAGTRGVHAYLNYAGPIFLDSGGFHFQRDGKATVGVADLLRTQASLRPNVTAVLDFPLHPKASIDENGLRWRRTMRNTVRMVEQTSGPLAIVMHSYDEMHTQRRCEQLRSTTPDPPIVCIGSLVPLLRGLKVRLKSTSQARGKSRTHLRWLFIAKLIQTVRSEFPDAMLHVFGAGTLSTILFLYVLGVDSVDSVAWRLKAAYGAIRLPGLGDRYMADFRHTRTRRRASSKCLKLLEACRCSICDGLRVSQRVRVFGKSFEARAIHNAQVFVDEVEAFHSELSRGTHLQFVYDQLADNPRYRDIYCQTVLPSLAMGGL